MDSPRTNWRIEEDEDGCLSRPSDDGPEYARLAPEPTCKTHPRKVPHSWSHKSYEGTWLCHCTVCGIVPNRAQGGPSVIELDALRHIIREQYITIPDDSHGEPYINRGMVSILGAIAEKVGDLDLRAPCEADANSRQTADVWCRTHVAPMGSRWSCELAEAPWEWRDKVALEPSTRTRDAERIGAPYRKPSGDYDLGDES